MKKRKPLGFKQALEYVLDLLCYAYYVKHDNLVSDQTFDQLERMYMKLIGEQTAPRRSKEFPEAYSKGVVVVYDIIKKKLKR